MLKLYNTLSRQVEVFKSREADTVKMFTCGPSIYRPPHLGNYRTFVWEDVLERYLAYHGYRVERVINLTDVEDKAIEEAEKEGRTILDLTSGVSSRFFQEAELLRIALPAHIPRSSTSVDQAARLIQILLNKQVAYRYGPDIFFDPLKFEGFGKLFRLDMSKWPEGKRRFKRDTYPGRRWNLGDFILWHGFREGDTIYWETEIGRGRPSWNIQDPAMITQQLGNTIDISCGGIDNLYRHHDYNLAVIEAVSGEKFAGYWVHGEHLLVNGKKMSKSLGNILYPEDLIKDGYTPEHIRFYLLYGQHRKRMNLTSAKVRQAAEKLNELRHAVAEIIGPEAASQSAADVSASSAAAHRKLLASFETHMDNDLNVCGAVDAIHADLLDLRRQKHSQALTADMTESVEKALRRIDGVLQVLF